MDNMVHKKGFTLIEIMILISLCMIVFTISFTKLSGYNKIRNNIAIDETGISIVNFINNCRDICRKEKKQGYIIYNTKKNNMSFSIDRKCVKDLNFPDEVSIDFINSKGGKIVIDNRGFTSNACTLRFKDNKGKIHKVTICVGSAHVEFKG